MKAVCDKCIYCYKPQSVCDYYKKTLKMPDLHFWGSPDFKHRFYLCSNENVAKIDHTNESTIYAVCEKENFHGNCAFYRNPNAEDIEFSTVEITASANRVKVGDSVDLEVTVHPFTKPAVTEEVTKIVNKPAVDELGDPLYDELGEPIMVPEEQTETVVVEEEYVNQQDITYKYTWYKNGRKIYHNSKPTITVTASEAAINEYYCVVNQSIKQNGDGGIKSVDINSEVVSVEFVEPEYIAFKLTPDTVMLDTSIPLPLDIDTVETQLENNWKIKSAEGNINYEVTEALLSNADIEAPEGVTVTIDSKINISVKPDMTFSDGITVKISWLLPEE